jgi:hypothetical protein
MMVLTHDKQAKKTEACGLRFDEAKFINKSLSALSKVISALAVNTIPTVDNKLNRSSLNHSLGQAPTQSVVHIPFRDSKLTRLLQTSLSGNSKTIIILTISGEQQHMSETISTLKFGESARLIKLSPKSHSQRVENDENLRSLVKTLRREITMLKQNLVLLNSQPKQIVGGLFTDSTVINSTEPMNFASNPTPSICEICQAFIDRTNYSNVNTLRTVEVPSDDSVIRNMNETVLVNLLSSTTDYPRSQPKSQESPPTDNQPCSAVDEAESEVTDVCPDDDLDEDEIIDRCAVCGMNSEESEQLKLDTGEELGFLCNCDGNCGNKFHIRCIGN